MRLAKKKKILLARQCSMFRTTPIYRFIRDPRWKPRRKPIPSWDFLPNRSRQSKQLYVNHSRSTLFYSSCTSFKSRSSFIRPSWIKLDRRCWFQFKSPENLRERPGSWPPRREGRGEGTLAYFILFFFFSWNVLFQVLGREQSETTMCVEFQGKNFGLSTPDVFP